jgi:flagellar protein FlaF
MSQDKIKAYAQTQKSSMPPREVEAMAFTKAALMLEEAKGKVDDYDSYAAALKFNQLLWTIIQADVVDNENQLPAQLKANILSLSIFVDRQTIKSLANTKAENLDTLININKNLAEGLMTRQANPAEAAPQQQAAQQTSSDLTA